MGCIYSRPVEMDPHNTIPLVNMDGGDPPARLPPSRGLDANGRPLHWDIVLKAITLGESGVGKTCLLEALTGKPWNGDTVSSIGVDMFTLCHACIEQGQDNGLCPQCQLSQRSPGQTIAGTLEPLVKFLMWDTAGQERFRSNVRMYYHDADIVLLCFKLGDKSSYERLESWYTEVREASRKKKARFVVVGLQEDAEEAALSTEFRGPITEGPLQHLPYYHCSAKRPASLEALWIFFCSVGRAAINSALRLGEQDPNQQGTEQKA